MWSIPFLRILLLSLLLSALSLPAFCSAIKCTFWRPMPPLVAFNQPVEHANPTGPVFSQRIQVVSSYYNPVAGPLLFHAGPEDPATLYTLSCLNLPQWAQSLQAGIIGVEHRGFGDSLPWGAVKNYSSVTLDNVLQDYAAVIRWAVSAQGPFPNAQGKVIVFGGSYGGFLSFMMKLRFPDLVLGSIASAAPLYLFGSAYLEAGRQGLWFDAVADTFTSFHPQCASRVSQAFQTATEMLSNRSFAQLRAQLRLCTLPTSAKKVTLLNYLRRSMQLVSQFNFPFKTPPFPFDLLCDENRAFTGVQIIAAAMDLGYNSTKKPITCFPWEGHSTTSREATDLTGHPTPRNLGGSSFTLNYEETWYYITCSYFVMPIAMNASIRTMWHYEDNWSIKGVTAYCMKKFSVSPTTFPPVTISDLQKDSVTNIVFSNMGYDPVRAFSLQRDISVNRSVTLLFANHAAHTEDICAPSEGESDGIVEMRAKELAIMQGWLNNRK